jgi:hypothetical protein
MGGRPDGGIHPYQTCRDRDCPLPYCRIYKEGVETGTAGGSAGAYERGRADGYAEGYSRGKDGGGE